MSFAHIWVLHFLWLAPVLLIAIIIANRRKDKALRSLADPELLERLTGRVLPGMRFFKTTLLLLALMLMITALAGPRWGSHYQEVSQKGVDIMLAVDVSPSMLVSDIKPTRLEQAKRKVRDFLKVIQGDRAGLVAFSGAAFVQCPLTLDYEALVMFLGQMDPSLIPVPGTDLGAAIDKAIESFDYKNTSSKVIVLITDGEDNEGHGQEAAHKARALGVQIYVFGIGDLAGGPVPSEGGKGGFAADDSGGMVISKLDEQGLSEIARLTGGRYVRSATGDIDLDMIYFAGIKAHTTAAELKSGKIKVYEERFAYAVTLALLLLILEGLLRERVPLRDTPGKGMQA